MQGRVEFATPKNVFAKEKAISPRESDFVIGKSCPETEKYNFAKKNRTAICKGKSRKKGFAKLFILRQGKRFREGTKFVAA